MKIDTAQMKRAADGSFSGEVTPTRFQFTSEQLVSPLRITRISVKDTTEALFYVQAPFKADLPDELTYQYQWIPMLQNARGWYDTKTFGGYELPGRADNWLKALGPNADAVVRQGQQLEFGFNCGQWPNPNPQGRTASALEWCRKFSQSDIEFLKGGAAFSEKLPDPDEGFMQADIADPNRRQKAYETIRGRLDQYRRDRPGGWLVREAPPAEVAKLKELLGHVREGQYVTKIRHVFTKPEMANDLPIVPAKWGNAADTSEYSKSLPTSPP
jgi:hypothetical protein